MKSSGFVLLVMLIYIQVISLVAVQSLLLSGGMLKTNRQSLIVGEMLRSAIAIMKSIDESDAAACMVERQSLVMLKRHELGWWQVHGCRFNGGNNINFYVRERLGIDTCAALLSPNKQMVAPIIYRNTLLQVSGLNHHVRAILQDTIAVESRTLPACNQEIRVIQHGRQMLRRLGE